MSGAKTYRVIQWATGSVGVEALRGIVDLAHLELAGVLVYGAGKEGRDAGSLCGRPDTGVRATRDREAILALPADCVVYAPLVPNLDDVCALLASGKNVVATPFLFFPRALPAADVARLERACAKGRSSVHGTGINPGFAGELLPLVLSGMSRRIRSVHVQERADWGFYDAPEMIFENMRFGAAPELARVEANPYLQFMSGLFQESVRMVAAGLGAALERVAETQELVVAPASHRTLAGAIEAGTVYAMRFLWQGFVSGVRAITLEALWQVGGAYPESWPAPKPGWTATLVGEPCLHAHFHPTASFHPGERPALADHVASASIATAMHAVNAVAPLCDAPPGIRTFLDLPMITGRGTLRP